MEAIQNQSPNEHVFLSTEIAPPRDIRSARAAGIIATLLFLVAAPFASRPLAHIPAFIATYESALTICDLITAVLLFGQFTILRSKALFILAGSYLFTALMTLYICSVSQTCSLPQGCLAPGTKPRAGCICSGMVVFHF